MTTTASTAVSRRADGSCEPVRRRTEQATLRRRGVYERLVKPVIDRSCGVILSLVTLPVVAVVALAIRWSMGSPVLFTQQRVGRHGVVFTVYKFRTMDPDRRRAQRPFLGADRRVTHKSDSDPRHTPLGRVLRRWSIDETPQFWNVALGQMSLVGPRPELTDVVARYERWQHRRHDVKPGLTGLWQISHRGNVPMHEATDVDLEYLDCLSFRTDLQILVKTLPALLKRRGA